MGRRAEAYSMGPRAAVRCSLSDSPRTGGSKRRHDAVRGLRGDTGDGGTAQVGVSMRAEGRRGGG